MFLKNKRAGLYYRASGELTAELGEAREFDSVRAAASFALSERLPDAEIALRCDYLAREVPLPVTALWCDMCDDDSLPARNPVPAAPPLSLPPSVNPSLRGDKLFPERLAEQGFVQEVRFV